MLNSRKQIWESLSKLYLDTELVASDFKWIAVCLKKHDMSLNEAKDINLYEVFPSLKWNLLSIAGVWDGFDDNWLFAKCSKNYSRRTQKLHRLKSRIEYSFFRKDFESTWYKIEEELKAHRNKHIL